MAYHEGAIEIVPLRYYKKSYQTDLNKTKPEIAKKFVQETNIDSLVVSIGNQSGNLKNTDSLDIGLLKNLNNLLPNIPFVLHGGSFLDKNIILLCIDNGVSKINVNTEVRLAYTNKLKNNLSNNPDEYSPYRLLNGVKDEMKSVIKNKILLFKNS